jgi:hypothetical protein
VEAALFFEALFDLMILLLKLQFKGVDLLRELFDFLKIFVILVPESRKLILKFLLALLHVSDSLLVFETNSPLPFNLSLQLMDGLLETNLVVEEFLDLPHAVSDDKLQLLLLDVQLLHLPVPMFGSTNTSALALFRGHGAGKVGTWFFELGLSLLHLFERHMLAFLNGDVPQYLVLLPEFLQDVISGDVLACLLAEVSAIGCVFDVLLLLRLCGGDVAGVYLFDGLIGVDCGFLLVEGGQVLVDFLEGLFHFYFGTGQHQLAFNYFELYLTVIQ